MTLLEKYRVEGGRRNRGGRRYVEEKATLERRDVADKGRREDPEKRRRASMRPSAAEESTRSLGYTSILENGNLDTSILDTPSLKY